MTNICQYQYALTTYTYSKYVCLQKMMTLPKNNYTLSDVLVTQANTTSITSRSYSYYSLKKIYRHSVITDRTI